MSLGTPGYLLLLMLPVIASAIIAWWLLWRARVRRQLGWQTRASVAARYAAPIALLVALVLVVFASARPQAGSHDILVEQRGVDVMIVLDVSNSMLANDVAPTRLGQAQTEITRLLDRMPGNRAGLVVFAGRPFVRSPVTADLPALSTIVAGVDRERALIPPGSDLGAAMSEARALLKDDDTATKALLVVSDGEDRGSGVSAAVTDAQRAGIRVYAAGAGTVGGSPVRDVDPNTGLLRDRTDDAGSPVLTRLDEAALRGIATAGGGRYIALNGDTPPLSGLAAEFDGLAQTAFGAKQSSQPIERFQILAAIALMLLVAPIVLPLLRQPRASLGAAARYWPLAGAGLLVGAICSSTVADINRRGNNAYARGDFGDALGQYRTAEAKAPGTGELYHNAGNALDRSGDYEQAIEETRRALPAKPGLVPLIQYGLGNHYAGAQRLDDASDAYKRALLANPADADAKHNLEIVSARSTPSPEPTSTPKPESRTPEPNSTGGDASTPVGGGTSAAGTPGPSGTDTASGPGTPAAGGDGQLTDEQLARALAEALAGKDKTFTQDEAIRLLDLLDETNRRAIENLGSGRNPNSLPDY